MARHIPRGGAPGPFAADDHPRRWLRLYSLPEGQRCPADDTNWRELLHRHLTVFADLVGEPTELLGYTERWQGLVTPNEADAYLFLRNLEAMLPHISPHALPIALPTSDHPRLLPVLTHLYHHLGERVELAPLARQFGFSTRTLSRLFQQELHLSFGQYLKLRRITAAMELLLKNQQAVGEVAYAVGYMSLPAFSNAFLQVVGRRPTNFLASSKKGP